MGDNDELGQSRLDSLYVIADVAFDSAESALDDLEVQLGISTVPTEAGGSLVLRPSGGPDMEL
jgi:hypothetical protein